MLRSCFFLDIKTYFGSFLHMGSGLQEEEKRGR